jgi:hypothetical protein
MEDSLPEALRKGDPAYPDADPSILEELDSLRRENMQYAEKLYRWAAFVGFTFNLDPCIGCHLRISTGRSLEGEQF